MLNGRAACPIGCKRRGAAILRRNCCRKEHLVGLVEAEWRRRTLEKIAIGGLPCFGPPVLRHSQRMLHPTLNA